MTLEQLVALLPTFAGAGALIAAIVNVLKKFGVVKDGGAGTASLLLNLALLVGLALAQVYSIDLTKWDTLAGGVAQIVAVVLTLLGQTGFAWGAHKLLKAGGVSILGYSHAKG